jgi:hypothetical protein
MILSAALNAFFIGYFANLFYTRHIGLHIAEYHPAIMAFFGVTLFMNVMSVINIMIKAGVAQ